MLLRIEHLQDDLKITSSNRRLSAPLNEACNAFRKHQRFMNRLHRALSTAHKANRGARDVCREARVASLNSKRQEKIQTRKHQGRKSNECKRALPLAQSVKTRPVPPTKRLGNVDLKNLYSWTVELNAGERPYDHYFKCNENE